jgi:hypothetical protein
MRRVDHSGFEPVAPALNRRYSDQDLDPAGESPEVRLVERLQRATEAVGAAEDRAEALLRGERNVAELADAEDPDVVLRRRRRGPSSQQARIVMIRMFISPTRAAVQLLVGSIGRARAGCRVEIIRRAGFCSRRRERLEVPAEVHA